jgi:hypothetical protein
MHWECMKTLEDFPSDQIISSPDTLYMKTKDERKQALEDMCDKVISKYVHLDFNKVPSVQKEIGC